MRHKPCLGVLEQCALNSGLDHVGQGAKPGGLEIVFVGTKAKFAYRQLPSSISRTAAGSGPKSSSTLAALGIAACCDGDETEGGDVLGVCRCSVLCS